MKLRRQKLLSLLLAASLAVSPVLSVGAEYMEEAAAEASEAAEENAQETEGIPEENVPESTDAAETEASAETVGGEEDTGDMTEDMSGETQETTEASDWENDAELLIGEPETETVFDEVPAGELLNINSGEDKNTIEEPRYISISSITNNTGMFKAVDAYVVETGGQKTLYLTLNGTGYQELFKGTYDEAVATGSDSSQWIVGTQRTDGKGFDGKYEFAIPVSDSDSYIQIQALSNNHKKDGWWWYPRYIRLDQSAWTLETGDYKETFDLAVTNNVKMFSVKGADLTITGGPHSDGYSITSKVTMGSTSFDKAYIGSADNAEAADAVITLSEDRKFEFTVEKIVGAGTTAEIDTILGERTVISFHSVKNDCWYERVFIFDKNARTLVIDDSEKADYAEVDAALAKVPSDLSIYTEETAAAVTAAKNAVKTGLYVSQQEKVDAMAKAVNDAVAALKVKPHSHSYGPWKTTKAATVFAPESQERTCSCGQKETRTVGKALTPTAKLNATSISLKVKQSTTKVTVSGLANGDSVKSWKSDNTKIVKVDEKTGKITAQNKTGKATVTVTLASGKSIKLNVAVQKKAVKTTKITGLSSKMTLKKGTKATLKPVIAPITSLEKVTYKSSNKKVATVSSKGVITAKAAGTAKITVTSGSKKVTVKVTVPKTATNSITNVKTSVTIVKGKTYTLKPKLSPSSSDDKITYSSSNKKVATVSSKGKIKAKKKGTATITVKAGKKKVTCKVTVK